MVGDILKTIREEKKITQDQIAQLLNIKRQTYSSYERNKSLPDINILSKLADYFNVSTDYLLGRSDIMNYDEYKDLLISTTKIEGLSDDEKQLLNSYRKLSFEFKAEIRGEIKGILRTSQDQSSSSGSESNKKII
ncbi:helix-turn-helix domain protein [Ruminiclostridium papyrosolvens DSM 2782]|uniref:Helix-turn-helix domain protein n=1 Tax=Ruminiclostridium papyrosolvens DSM 2782 TaxID=588581 RepID=F1TH25_9FIRM|nr:helix-turn-helix transcriptional regulator [Ruminiclostridium papyrosolvens]EGD46265.1 helix-turn-helix domain protein [Ruminiclostridium papyrosolvens DSM 2782]WES33013.1 helix-turn-helix transcriptional regulator [Ruminiclostridium papyrosolvens DSM 2782]